MSHAFDGICEHGTVHEAGGCPECPPTPDGRSPHGSTFITCPTPDQCAVGGGHPARSVR